MATALNKARETPEPFDFPQCAGQQVLMTHFQDGYIIRAIPVQGFRTFQTACLRNHIGSALGMTAGCIINNHVLNINSLHWIFSF